MKTILSLTTISTLFVGLLLVLVQPFSIENIGPSKPILLVGNIALCFFSSLIVLSGLKKAGLENKLDKTNDIVKYTVAYLLIILPFLSSLYFFYHKYYFAIMLPSRPFPDNYFITISLQVLFVSILLTPLLYFFLKLQSENRYANKMRQLVKLLEERVEELNSSKVQPVEEKQLEKIVISGDYKGTPLEISPKDIVFIESASNYANVNYIDNGEKKEYLVRTTMKSLREQLKDFPYLVSTHRSFIVNINFVNEVKGNSSIGFHLSVLGIKNDIPLAKGCYDSVLNALSIKEL